MPKYLLPAELAEIVCGLLVQPALLNELKTPATHKAFMQDIGWWRNIAAVKLTA